jgi:hypothetical protein
MCAARRSMRARLMLNSGTEHVLNPVSVSASAAAAVLLTREADRRGITTVLQPLLLADRPSPRKVGRHNQGAVFPAGVLAAFGAGYLFDSMPAAPCKSLLTTSRQLAAVKARCDERSRHPCSRHGSRTQRMPGGTYVGLSTMHFAGSRPRKSGCSHCGARHRRSPLVPVMTRFQP